MNFEYYDEGNLIESFLEDPQVNDEEVPADKFIGFFAFFDEKLLNTSNQYLKEEDNDWNGDAQDPIESWTPWNSAFSNWPKQLIQEDN